MFYIIIGMTLLLIAILILLKDGLINLKVTKWEIKNSDYEKNWNDIFDNSQKLEVKPLFNGICKEAPGVRPWLNEETIPDSYDMFAPSNCPIMNFSVKHNKYGDILIDAGMNSSFNQSNINGDLPAVMRIYLKQSKYHYSLNENENIKYNMKKYQLDPKYVFITHVHADHVSGLTEMNSDVITVIGERENSFFYKLICGKYFKGKKSIKTLDFSNAQRIGPFSKVIDLFGDNSILAISSPGHSEDHISYFINDSDSPVLIIGDLINSEDDFNSGIEVSCDSSSRDKKILQNSINELKEFKKQNPHIKVLYMHDNK